MDIILEEMQDVESSCIDEVILPEKEDDLQVAFPAKSEVPQCEVSTEVFTEPSGKRIKSDTDRLLSPREAMILRQLVTSIGRVVCNRLDAMEEKLEGICINSKYLEDKLEQMIQKGSRYQNSIPNNNQKNVLEVDCESQSSDITKQEMKILDFINMSGDMRKFNFITLNREEDYLHGSWLGDENKPEMRVRVAISQQDLLHVNSNCQTPMKMALTLLDYLFDRDTLASSNLSGHSKHGKKQLDPLLIYGIRCHLIHRFRITEDDWKHVKLNMDSKCRTAFRRKMLGMPLTVKAFRGKVPSVINSGSEASTIEFIPSDESFQNADSDVMNQEDVNISQLMMMETGSQKIQLINATPEQLSHLNIRVLNGRQVMDLSDSDTGVELFSPETASEVVCLVKSEIEDEEH